MIIDCQGRAPGWGGEVTALLLNSHNFQYVSFQKFEKPQFLGLALGATIDRPDATL